MAVAPFRVFSRKSKGGKRTFSARFLDEAGHVVRTQALKATTRAKASREAEAIFGKGIVYGAEDMTAEAYLLAFWKMDSAYVKGRALRGHTISPRYVEENARTLRLHAFEYLRGLRFREIGPATLEKIILENARKGTSPRVINRTLQAITVPYAYFCKLNRLANPLPSVERLKENPKARGVLSADEITRALAVNEDPRVIAAIALGAFCGLRAGEIRGLQWDAIDEEESILHVHRNYVSDLEGVKGCKQGSERMVPLPGPALGALRLVRAFASAKVKTEGAAFAIYNERTPSKPIPVATLERGFRRVLEEIGINAEERKKRNLVFHGLRHAYVSFCRASGLPDYIVQRLSGHRSSAMLENYSHADRRIVDFTAARESIERALKVGVI